MPHINLEGKFPPSLAAKFRSQMLSPAPLIAADYHMLVHHIKSGITDETTTSEDTTFLDSADNKMLLRCSAITIDVKKLLHSVTPSYFTKAKEFFLENHPHLNEEWFANQDNDYLNKRVILDLLEHDLFNYAHLTTAVYHHEQQDGKGGCVGKSKDMTLLLLGLTSNVLCVGDAISGVTYRHEKRESANEAYFGFMVAAGLVSRDALRSNHMLRQLNNLELDSAINRFKEEGIEPITSEPLITKEMLNNNREFYY